MNTIKNVLKNNYRNSELDEFLKEELKDAGFGGADIQKSPLGTRLTLYVTRPGLVIGRKGSGIRDLTSKLEVKFGLTNPQISVVEVEVPELNPKIMCNRLAQLIERGTAFRRAALWTVNTIKNAGALGVEVTISGKLRSERAHFEKHSSGIIPKSGNMADKVVREGITHVLTKMGIMGIRLKIAIKNASPPEFELITNFKEHNNQKYPPDNKNLSDSDESNLVDSSEAKQQKEILENTGEINK
ncbi:MAG TPA: 30S ribosomal protein S3 [Candidatus Nitrosocosmicus sp.]|jgi:small subunit ribosomal protein S3|nr:30S ribosomal protein S3 [Candidatus Nitrosocosmicus sp.]